MTADLVKRLNARETVREFLRGCDLVRQAYAQVREAKDIFEAAFQMGNCSASNLSVQDQYGREPYWERPEDTIAHLETQAWQTIVQRLELRQFLSNTRWEELQRNMRDGKMPPITEENVLQLFQSFAGQLDELIAESVTEVYNWLRPWRETYKTNDKFQVGKKVILECMVSRKYSGRGFDVSYHGSSDQRLTALENVFSSLDGKGQMTKGWRSNLSEAIRASDDGRGETEYFAFKCFKKGTLHLTFKRDDLVFRFNQIAGAGKLKGAA